MIVAQKILRQQNLLLQTVVYYGLFKKEPLEQNLERKRRAERPGPCNNPHRRTRRRTPTGKGSACRPCAYVAISIQNGEHTAVQFLFFFVVTPRRQLSNSLHPAALARHGFRCRTPAQPIDRCAYRPGEVPGLMRERPPAQPNLTLAEF